MNHVCPQGKEMTYERHETHERHETQKKESSYKLVVYSYLIMLVR